jgi:diaminopimelate epimerase
MRSSRWHAHGNVYIVHEGPAGRVDAAGTDGVLEVLAVAGDEVTIGILNTDGSRAEMSGNGTRIAAAWLMERTGSPVARVHVGPRTVEVRRTADGLYESELGEVVVGPQETVAGVRVTPVSVGNPHAVVLADPGRIVELGPLLETHPRFPERTNVQVARVDGPGEVTARVWERGVGETSASGTSAVAVAAATHGDGEVVVHFPGGDLRVRLATGRASLTGPAEPVGESPAPRDQAGSSP